MIIPLVIGKVLIPTVIGCIWFALIVVLAIFYVYPNEASPQTDEFVLVYQTYCLWRRDAGFCLPAGRQAGMLDAG